MTIEFARVEAVLLQQLRKKQRMWLWGGIAISAVCVLGTYALFKLSTAPNPSVSGAVKVACVGTIPAIIGIITALRDPRRSPAFLTLRDRAKTIVWLYVFTARGQAMQSWVMLGLDDGNLQRLPVELGREQEILAVVAGLAPWAKLGFLPERERQFLAAPPSLRDGSM